MKVEEQIHPSHKIDHNPNTIVGERFASTWECTGCGYSAYDTVAGGRIDQELKEPCQLGDKREYIEFQIAKTERQLVYLKQQLEKL